MKPSSLRFFIQDNNDIFAQQRCLDTTTTMFWHANNDVFKRQ